MRGERERKAESEKAREKTSENERASERAREIDRERQRDRERKRERGRERTGEYLLLLDLVTAIFSITIFIFESTAKRIGVFDVSFIRVLNDNVIYLCLLA